MNRDQSRLLKAITKYGNPVTARGAHNLIARCCTLQVTKDLLVELTRLGYLIQPHGEDVEVYALPGTVVETSQEQAESQKPKGSFEICTPAQASWNPDTMGQEFGYAWRVINGNGNTVTGLSNRNEGAVTAMVKKMLKDMQSLV